MGKGGLGFLLNILLGMGCSVFGRFGLGFGVFGCEIMLVKRGLLVVCGSVSGGFSVFSGVELGFEVVRKFELVGDCVWDGGLCVKKL